MVKVSLSSEELEKISIDYMSKEGYYIESQTDNQLIFTGGKDINNTILVLSFLIFVIGGILYYILSKSHTISISLTEIPEGLDVTSIGSTKESRVIAKDFEDNLVTFTTVKSPIGYNIQEMKCPRCGSSLDYQAQARFIKCAFCGASLSINELRK